MYRTNAQSRLLEEAFLHAGLPYKLVGAQRFYGRREIKDVIAYLRLVHNPNDEISLTRVINAPPRGIGDKTSWPCAPRHRKLGLSPGGAAARPWVAMATCSQHDVACRARRGRPWSILAVCWRVGIAMKARLPPLALMDRILEDSGLPRLY